MTAREFYEWAKENDAEDYSMEVVHDADKSHMSEVVEDEKKIIIYTK